MYKNKVLAKNTLAKGLLFSGNGRNALNAGLIWGPTTL